MKSLDVNVESSKFGNCELSIQANLFEQHFFKMNANLVLNSIFKTPNVRSYNLLKEDFYVKRTSDFSSFLKVIYSKLF
jgi:hypothetical protein